MVMVVVLRSWRVVVGVVGVVAAVVRGPGSGRLVELDCRLCLCLCLCLSNNTYAELKTGHDY